MKYLLILITLVIAVGCNRKVNIQTSRTEVDSSMARKVDSITQVNKTLSEAYESLLQTSNSTGVVFESIPCDTIRIPGAPRIINRVIVSPDGTKTFEGAIKSYKDESASWQRWAYQWKSSYDSLSLLTDSLALDYKKLQEQKSKVVKVVTIPWWLIVGGLIFLALWINERFDLFKIPFLTKNKSYVKS
jgi:hypothetical protein